MNKTFLNNFEKIQECVEYIDIKYLVDTTDFYLQIEIIGEGSGIFYIEYKNGSLNIEPYNYYDHSAHLQATTEVIIALVTGKIRIGDAMKFGDINIISKRVDGVKNVISFFEACYNYYNFCSIESKAKDDVTSPWDSLREYIEKSNIDEESKKQLLANLVKFTSNELHILIVGACGCGKSSTINALFNMEIAQVGYGVDPKTQEVSGYKLDNLYLHDTPGLGESTEKDKEHIEKIKNALLQVDSEGNAVIDVVLVIVDGSHRDMKSSFELINDVIIPNLKNKDRILIGINRCDLALDGRGWVEKYNYPSEELLQRLEEKTKSVKERIKRDTGVEVEPVFYSALHKYNISKLLSYLVKSAPTKKRVFFAEKINKNKDYFLRDDTVVLSKKRYTNNRSSNELYKEVNTIKSSINGIERRLETLHEDVKSNYCKESNLLQEKFSVDNGAGEEYELVKKSNVQYNEETKSSLEEGFQAAEVEINKGSKEKIKFSFAGMLNDVKNCAKAGAELGKELGANVPVIGVTVGGAVGAIIGGVGGLFMNILGGRK